jgi:hypothetical protein
VGPAAFRVRVRVRVRVRIESVYSLRCVPPPFPSRTGIGWERRAVSALAGSGQQVVRAGSGRQAVGSGQQAVGSRQWATYMDSRQ